MLDLTNADAQLLPKLCPGRGCGPDLPREEVADAGAYPDLHAHGHVRLGRVRCGREEFTEAV